MAESNSLIVSGGIQEPKKANDIYNFRALNIDGEMVDLAKYKGHVCIIVNVASKWGKTAVNYEQLQKLQNEFSDADKGGLRILGFPCNQFGSQEPGTNEEIKKFAENKGATFDMFAKIDVNGSHEHPLYTYLKNKQHGTLTNAIKWNFTKFVINKEGVAVARFGPTDDPIPKVEKEVKKLMGI